MRIVLFTFNASWVHTSLSLRCLRETCEKKGYEVVLVEHTLRDRSAHVLEHLYREKGDVYGFSCYIWNLDATLSLGRTLHEILPNAKIVLGGPEVSFATERFDGMDWIDAIVCGEGESVFPTLCEQIEAGVPHERILCGKSTPDFEQTGTLYRTGEGTGGILYYESSRGCPFSCAYCLSSATHGVRAKSVSKTLADLLEFERIHADCKVIKFIDRTFNANVARANEIWRGLLDDAFTKHYHFEVCASLLNEESLDILSRFPKGKIQLEIGLQSTNPETLNAVARHISPQAVIEKVKRIHEMGNIHVHLDLIAGLPYESYERFSKSFDEAYGSCDLLQLGFLKLLHGTALRDSQERYGYKCLPNPPYTVLESNWISYEELSQLSHIAEVLERYLESGRFAHTLWYLTPLMPSPFAFWEGLTCYLAARDGRPLQKLSQPDVFRYLLEYASSLPNVQENTLRQMLSADFTTHEHKNPPSFLSVK